MDSPDIISCDTITDSIHSSNNVGSTQVPKQVDEDMSELQNQVIENYQKPNLPNVNVPEKIVICLDVCYDDLNSLYLLGDGTSFSQINMMKRILDFFIHTKNAINKKAEFALVVLKSTEPHWVQNFSSNVKDIISALDFVTPEESSSENFDFKKLFQLVKQKVEIPEYKQGECILPPPYVVRMLLLYNRSKTIPLIPQEDSYLTFLKKQMYFYIDIILAHEENCAVYKCEEIYDALQNLDNGYSYVFEVSRNATKIHDCIAKLLAHPLQRPLQKNTDYSFATNY